MLAAVQLCHMLCAACSPLLALQLCTCALAPEESFPKKAANLWTIGVQFVTAWLPSLLLSIYQAVVLPRYIYMCAQVRRQSGPVPFACLASNPIPT